MHQGVSKNVKKFKPEPIINKRPQAPRLIDTILALTKMKDAKIKENINEAEDIDAKQIDTGTDFYDVKLQMIFFFPKYIIIFFS